jgi:hypothetical protein
MIHTYFAVFPLKSNLVICMCVQGPCPGTLQLATCGSRWQI